MAKQQFQTFYLDYSAHYRESLINGNELKNYDLNTFWQSVGYISQDSTIYNLTLRENLKLRNNKISDDTLYKYLNEYGLNKIGASDKINLDMKIDESSLI